MIFLDVTGTCRSPKNTGMQRMTRRIYRELRKRTSVRPICWNTLGNFYQDLGARELAILTRPFENSRALARPDLRGENFLAETKRFALRKRVRLENEMQSSDALLVPDLYRDGRIRELPELLRANAARSVAIFHDAASIRLGILSQSAEARFRKYIDSLGAFDHVVCISRASCDDLENLWTEDGVKPTATSVEVWPIEFDEKFRGDGAAARSNLVTSVGSFEPRKNQLRLLRAAESLWQQNITFELELIGRATGYYGPTVTKELRRLQRRGHPLRWLRHVDDNILHRAYADCRFSVYPSLTEGFGLPIAESLWHGKPCICGSNGALGEIASGGGCLLVDQESEDSLGKAMRTLLTDQNKYERLCAEARARKFRAWPDYMANLLGYLGVSA